jgi:hypothetical protein
MAVFDDFCFAGLLDALRLGKPISLINMGHDRKTRLAQFYRLS